MDLTIAEIATSFSHHRFEEAYPFLLEDIEWTLVGGTDAHGKDAVMAICEGTTEGLAGVETTFHRFKVIEADDCVVIDSRAEYVEEEGRSSSVASCDIYDFADGRLAAITSYTVELSAASGTT
jgi:ketosteroid isomerase-like protein